MFSLLHLLFIFIGTVNGGTAGWYWNKQVGQPANYICLSLKPECSLKLPNYHSSLEDNPARSSPFKNYSKKISLTFCPLIINSGSLFSHIVSAAQPLPWRATIKMSFCSGCVLKLCDKGQKTYASFVSPLPLSPANGNLKVRPFALRNSMSFLNTPHSRFWFQFCETDV